MSEEQKQMQMRKVAEQQSNKAVGQVISSISISPTSSAQKYHRLYIPLGTSKSLASNPN